MPDRITTAIITRWTAQGLGTSFTGGIWVDMAPRDTVYPYVILRIVNESPDRWASDLELDRCLVDLHVFYKENNSTDPVSAIGTLMRTLQSAFDRPVLTITGRNFQEMRRQRQSLNLYDPDRRIWLGVLGYAVLTNRSTTCPPA